MFFIVMLALLLLSASVAFKYKKNILDVTAMFFAALILTLYALAFFRAMKLIAVVALLIICLVLVGVFKSVKGSGTSATSQLGHILKLVVDPYLLWFALATIFVGIATKDMIFTWWDDMNFWSSDAKQFFYLNGFPGKYGNVSPEFGDYPPVTSIVKWLFLQIRGKEYTESLQFLGYFFLNGVFLLPLLEKIREYVDGAVSSKIAKWAVSLVIVIASLLIPGVFNGIIYYGTPADVTMAILYGALLLSIYDSSGHGNLFYFSRIALYASVLLLTKTVGFEWTLFALVFYLLMGKRDKAIWASVGAAAASFGSWSVFCLINRRVAKLTGASVKMATSGKYTAPENAGDKLLFFIEGFALEPMHSDHNITIDLSTLAAVVLIFIFVFVLYNMKILGKRETKKIALFTLITGLIAYGIVFLAHISIFQGEDQYLNAFAMGISIARYCAPFTLGSFYLLTGIMFNRLKGKNGWAYRLAACLVAAFVFLTADYSGVYKYLAGYRTTLAKDKNDILDMVGDEGFKITKAVSDERYWGKRVLIFRDGHEYYWVHNTYINREASPVPLVYSDYLAETDTPQSIMDKIRASHAEYIYVEDETGESYKVFSEMIKNGDYKPGVVYSLAEVGN